MTYRPVSSFVGVAESELGTVSGQTPLRMMASATLDALAEAGLALADVLPALRTSRVASALLLAIDITPVLTGTGIVRPLRHLARNDRMFTAHDK